MVGSLPNVFQNLDHLTSLDLSYNSLTGAVPDSVCYLKSLTSLFLCSNSNTSCTLASVPLCVADAPYSVLNNLKIKEIGNLSNPQKGEFRLLFHVGLYFHHRCHLRPVLPMARPGSAVQLRTGNYRLPS